MIPGQFSTTDLTMLSVESQRVLHAFYFVSSLLVYIWKELKVT